ncbi:MAG TPA: Wzz/FepE/Etk N-terminal domain-containing protein [Candidatus Dormibacteraeota bacterium]|nr:Wzz/FepE/Etk N-terminal domain-containing protein [Candidatus Dormibacteraeota bacterium]
MNYSSGAPARQPVPELPETDYPVTPLLEQTEDRSDRTLNSLRLLWDHRRILLRVAVYALLASTLVAFVIPSRYESVARLMPPDNQSGSGLAMAAAAMSGAAGGLGGIASDFLGLKSTSDVFVGILTSRTVQDKLIQQFDLKKLYGARRMEDARKDLTEHTVISVERKSQIISITVTDRSPQRAAAMGQAYVEELNNLVAELSTSSARRERIFLEGRLQAVNQDLEAAEKDFSQFASKNTAIDVKEQGKAMVEAAALLQGQLISAQSQYEGLREIYTDNNPRVRTVRARIDELQRQLEKLGGKGESATSIASQSGDSMYPSIRKLPLLGVTFADLYRRTKIQEAVLETLTKEYEMAKVQEVKEIPTVKVLDVAQIPDKKSFPPRLLIMFLGTAFSFVVATTWIIGKTMWDETDASDARKVFAQEVFSTVAAHVPVFSQNGSEEHSVNGGVWDRFRRRKLGSSASPEGDEQE